uniref:Uncharacterized protein n=1 Tax=Oncorhynchus kisutch TaxID=8019 RepID=A0A8C7N4B0_ONCKI
MWETRFEVSNDEVCAGKSSLSDVALLSCYQLLFYQKDGSVEMFDVKNQRTLLRGTTCHDLHQEDLHQEDLFVGNRVNVFSCQLNLIVYWGPVYRKQARLQEREVCVVQCSHLKGWERSLIACCFTFHLFVCVCMKQAADFYTEHQTKSFFHFFMLGFSDTWKQFMTSGPGVAMELMDLGPTDWDVAQKEARPSLRAQVGTDDTRNAGHRSDSLASAARELEFFFPATAGHGPANTATDCACCVINPHAISEGKEDLLIFHMERSFFIMLFYYAFCNSNQIKCIYIALRTSADISKCCTETQPKTPNSKQCRCRSTVARKNSLERPKPRKNPREEPGYVGWPILFWLCRVEIITEHGQDVQMFINDQHGPIIIRQNS